MEGKLEYGVKAISVALKDNYWVNSAGGIVICFADSSISCGKTYDNCSRIAADLSREAKEKGLLIRYVVATFD